MFISKELFILYFSNSSKHEDLRFVYIENSNYIARSKGLNIYGIKADKQHYPDIDRLRFREKLAMVKAFMEITINKKPRFSGEKIPITGNSVLSYDEK